jgi:FKBP-type peptidyl-prolyl cis-trans isomerase SlyD
MDISMSEADVIGGDKVVSFHYRMYKIDDDGHKGDLLESSFGANPVFYLHGYGNVIAGLESAMAGKPVGAQFEVTVPPERAYGLRKPNALQRIPVKHLHLANKKQKLPPGAIITVQTDQGPRQVVVVKAGKFTVDVDTNHPLAGAILHYEIQIESIRNATPEEIGHGHVHGPGGHHH